MRETYFPESRQRQGNPLSCQHRLLFPLIYRDKIPYGGINRILVLSNLKTRSRSLYVKNGVAITLKKECGEVCYLPPNVQATRLLCLSLEKQKYQEDALFFVFCWHLTTLR